MHCLLDYQNNSTACIDLEREREQGSSRVHFYSAACLLFLAEPDVDDDDERFDEDFLDDLGVTGSRAPSGILSMRNFSNSRNVLVSMLSITMSSSSGELYPWWPPGQLLCFTSYQGLLDTRTLSSALGHWSSSISTIVLRSLLAIL
jgi:hypothetical protein